MPPDQFDQLIQRLKDLQKTCDDIRLELLTKKLSNSSDALKQAVQDNQPKG